MLCPYCNLEEISEDEIVCKKCDIFYYIDLTILQINDTINMLIGKAGDSPEIKEATIQLISNLENLKNRLVANKEKPYEVKNC